MDQSEGRFSTGPMKALQILQTLMLLAVIGIGTWIGSTTVESSKSISRMEETIRGISNDNQRLTGQLQRLTDEHYALDRRVTTIEARGYK
jgi:hypothetical protein